MHGLGNDFVIIDNNSLKAQSDIASFARRISDRRFGIGCDQFIVYEIKGDNRVLMSIYNQDGSSALACGNASRCLSRLIFDQTGQREIKLDVSGREVKCLYRNDHEIEVDMGAVVFNADWIPEEEALWSQAMRFGIEPKEMIPVDVGNPHVVIFTNLAPPDMAIIGENLQKAAIFKGGINVDFAKIIDGKIILKVWERGVGFTLACGSGACATFAAANNLGFVGKQSEVVFTSGSLKMYRRQNQIIMSGKAEYVFTGEYIYA